MSCDQLVTLIIGIVSPIIAVLGALLGMYLTNRHTEKMAAITAKIQKETDHEHAMIAAIIGWYLDTTMTSIREEQRNFLREYYFQTQVYKIDEDKTKALGSFIGAMNRFRSSTEDPKYDKYNESEIAFINAVKAINSEVDLSSFNGLVGKLRPKDSEKK